MALLDAYNTTSLFDEFTRAYNRIVELYQKRAELDGVLNTITNFATLRDEQRKETEAIQEELDVICDDILYQIKRFEQNGRFKEVKESNQKRIAGLKHKFSENFGKQIFRWGLDKIDDPEALEHLMWAEKGWLTELSDLFGGESLREVELLIEKAYKKAFVLKKNEAQLTAIESVLSDVIRDGHEGYTTNIGTLQIGSDEAKEKFQQAKPGPKTPNELKADIEEIIKGLPNKKKYYRKDGSLVIKQAVKYALDEDKDFIKKWGSEGKDYSKRHLAGLFSEAYSEMKNSNSS